MPCPTRLPRTAARELHREAAVADDDRRDRGLAQPPMLKPSAAEPLLQVARVLPQLLDALRFLLQHVERRDARGGDRRRMRRREQERPRAVVEELDEVARAADVAAERADRLRQRADLDVDAAVQLK